jgi:IPT/TIG domain
VTQLNAGAAAAEAGQFVYNAVPGAPVVASASPTSGNPAGGDTVTMTGSGFTGVTAVSFGQAPAASFTFISDTQITAVSPPGNGAVNVMVTTPLGKSAPTAIQTTP